MENTNVPMSKRLIGIGIAIVCIVVACLIPGSEALPAEGVKALGLLLALVALWVTSALPLGVTALFIVVMCPVLGIVGNLGQAIGGFASPALLFIIAVFSLPVIMLKTKWGVRLINALLGWTGANSRKMVLGFMIATTLVSTVMSDVPCTVLFLGFALTILKAAGAEPPEVQPWPLPHDRHPHRRRHRWHGHPGRQLVQRGCHEHPAAGHRHVHLVP